MSWLSGTLVSCQVKVQARLSLETQFKHMCVHATLTRSRLLLFKACQVVKAENHCPDFPFLHVSG